MKLKTKIQLSSSVFMLVLVLCVNLSSYYFFHKMSIRTELEELNLISDNVITALNKNPSVEPRGLIEAYLPANGMIRVILKNEVPMYELTKSKDYLTLPWKYANGESRTIISQDNGPSIATITKPIIWQTGKHKGEVVTIQVSNYLISLHETMRTLMYVLGTLSIIALLPVLFASSLLSRFLLRPIQILIKTMKNNMNQGDWQKIDIGNRSRDEMYEMEMTFNEMMEHLKASYDKQEMFVSDASHELKTPIQIIKSYAQLLARRKEIDPEVLQESVQAIDLETDRIKNLIEQMLSLAKNKQINLKEDVNLIEIVKKTIIAFRGVYDREISLLTNETNIFVRGNAGQLEQIVFILIDNGMKYSKDKIDVQVFNNNGSVLLQVKDYGQGIAEKDIERIFDRFYRVDKARSRDSGGTGLGLAIAKAIAKNHGGELYVESKKGEGSTFTLKLSILN